MSPLKAELTHIVHQLLKKEKKPSIALIKAKAPSGTPLSEIITVVQEWKSQPERFEDVTTIQPNTSSSDSDEEAENSSNRSLVARIEELEKKVAFLTDAFAKSQQK